MDTIGFKAPPTLDGYHLAGYSPEQLTVRPRELVEHVRAKSGAMREGRPRRDPDLPLVAVKYTITLDWRHLGAHTRPVASRLAEPGPHDFALWKHEFLAYRGDGSRTEFRLPWRQAVHVYAPPEGQSAARFAMEVRLGHDGAELPVEDRDTAAYEAGAPAAGAVWAEVDGVRFKLGTPPAAGTIVSVAVVPLFRVFHGSEGGDRQYRSPAPEPRRIVLEEA